jgi:predicted metal-dependent peptidase
MSRTPFTEVKLTSEQEHALNVARVAFSIQSPFYAHTYHELGKEVISRDVPTAATDGRHIVINPEYFCAHITPEQVFILAHEMSHVVGRHTQRIKHYQQEGNIRGKPFDAQFANICADYVINADLVETKVGQHNPDWLLHPDVKGSDLWEEVYERLWVDPPVSGSPTKPPGQGDQPGQCAHIPRTPAGDGKRVPGKRDPQAQAKGGQFDDHLPPPVNPVTGESQLPTEDEFREAVVRAAAVAKSRGQLPANIKRMVDELLTPQVNWREHVRMLITGKVGFRGETWVRPNRRRLALNPIVIMPGKKGYGAELVVVGVDTSGSIGKKGLDIFFGEIGGVLADVRPRRIMVIGCDFRVTQVDEVGTLDEFEGVRAEGIKGGGGTRFEPVFDHVEENNLRPECLIYLTDGKGSFPDEAPAYPVIWGMTGQVEPPFGETVKIELN